MTMDTHHVGLEAVQTKGWWRSYKWLMLRRFSQLGILAAFLIGPIWGVWLVKGNLSSSLTLDVLPLTDPFVLLQTIVAGAQPMSTALIGAAIITVFYLVVGGRMYCSWVCPVNMITDAASWLRRKLGIKGSGTVIDKNVRYWILLASLVAAFFTQSVAWELVNPISLLHRGILFGIGFGWSVILSIFLLDVFVSNRAWCGRLCPVGAFYSLLNVTAQLRVSADKRDNCDDCMDCFQVCPEPQVIQPALKGCGSPIISSINCTNCARCIDVCAEDVFHFSGRTLKKNITITQNSEALP